MCLIFLVYIREKWKHFVIQRMCSFFITFKPWIGKESLFDNIQKQPMGMGEKHY